MNITERILIESSDSVSETNLAALSASKGVITISEPISAETSVKFALLLKHLAAEEKELTILIDCPGGEVNAGLVMYDLIQAYPYGVDMYCIGLAASMAALLLAGGRKGRRFILPHGQVMIHEPLIAGSFGGSATEIEKKSRNILGIKSALNHILAEHTGKSLKEIDKATSFDNYMSAEKAVEFGICDAVRSIY
ncbi:MAG: ClpP family protease [Ruminiclostridium sp.]